MLYVIYFYAFFNKRKEEKLDYILKINGIITRLKMQVKQW